MPLLAQVIETGLPASDVKESLHKLQVGDECPLLSCVDVIPGRRVHFGQDHPRAAASELAWAMLLPATLPVVVVMHAAADDDDSHAPCHTGACCEADERERDLA